MQIDQQQKDETIYCFDKLNRKHLKRLVAGPALIKLRSTIFGGSTPASHCNDILPLLKNQVENGKRIVFLKVDNGSDWDLHLIINELYFFRLWKASGLDILGIVSYSARYSAYNNIEHLWSPMSKKLNSVLLPSKLEGEDQPPCKQSQLTAEEKEEKEAKVFDNAMDLVTNEYWRGAMINESDVVCNYRPCQSVLPESLPYGGYSGCLQTIMLGLQEMTSIHSFLLIMRQSY